MHHGTDISISFAVMSNASATSEGCLVVVPALHWSIVSHAEVALCRFRFTKQEFRETRLQQIAQRCVNRRTRRARLYIHASCQPRSAAVVVEMGMTCIFDTAGNQMHPHPSLPEHTIVRSHTLSSFQHRGSRRTWHISYRGSRNCVRPKFVDRGKSKLVFAFR